MVPFVLRVCIQSNTSLNTKVSYGRLPRTAIAFQLQNSWSDLQPSLYTTSFMDPRVCLQVMHDGFAMELDLVLWLLIAPHSHNTPRYYRHYGWSLRVAPRFTHIHSLSLQEMIAPQSFFMEKPEVKVTMAATYYCYSLRQVPVLY